MSTIRSLTVKEGFFLKTGVSDAVGVDEDVHRDVEGGACLPVCVCLYRVFTRLGREASGYPPHFSRSFARGGDGALSGFEKGRDLLRGALVPRSVKNARVRRGRKWGLHPR